MLKKIKKKASSISKAPLIHTPPAQNCTHIQIISSKKHSRLQRRDTKLGGFCISLATLAQSTRPGLPRRHPYRSIAPVQRPASTAGVRADAEHCSVPVVLVFGRWPRVVSGTHLDLTLTNSEDIF